MGKPLKNEAGARYGKWLVLERASTNKGTAASWVCRCDCGTISEISGASLRRGESTKCRQCNQEGGPVLHGMSKTDLYGIWIGIKRRTENQKCPSFKNYGGRGIKICDEWKKSFTTFASDVGLRPAGHSLERLDNNGPYSKWNCVWATREEQSRNTRQNVMLTMEGKTLCMKDWAKSLGIPYSTIADRVRRYGRDQISKILFKGSLKEI